MNEQLIISIIGGLVLGVGATGIGGLLLRYFGDSLSGGMDIDLYYAELDELKRMINADSESHGRGTAATLRTLLLQYGLAVSMVMMLVLRIALALPLTLPVMGLALLVVWLLVAGVPIGIMMAFKMKQVVILEMASVLGRVVRSEDDNEEWIIEASKSVFGGDLFGEDQEDRLVLRITRTNIAPVALSVSGHVVIADNGLERTVNKRTLRQLRLKDWFVDELSSTEADINHEWSLHDSTYADIANDLSQIVESLGFSMRHIRIRKVSVDAELASPASLSPSKQATL